MPRHPDPGNSDADTQARFDALATALVLEGSAVLCDVLPVEHIEQMARRLKTLDDEAALQAASMGRRDGRRRNDAVRSDAIFWLQASDSVDNLWLAFAERLRQALNERLFLGLFDYEAHYARYAPGAFYARHQDAFVGQRNRVVSTVLYLNTDWLAGDGGELLLYDEAGETPRNSVLPCGNKLVVFLSERVPHEVRAARRTRYSVAGWFRVRN